MEPPPPYFSRAKPICRLSDPAQPHKLCRRRRPSYPPLSICFSCKGKHLKRSKYYYYCATCNLEFHRGCHIFLPEIRSAFHPSHPLTFISLLPKFNVTKIPKDWNDSSASGESENDGDDDYKEYEDDDDEVEESINEVVDEDDGDDDDDASLSDGNHLECSMRPPAPIISHLKSHEHTLTLFPIRLPLPCDACGLSLNDPEDLVYSCLPCSRMVHKSCIYLPRVIKITRHPHRLSLTSSLQPGDFSCGVCRKTVDVNYGQYSCNKGCHYAIHSKCATRKQVWDGKDLEGVPEEPDEYIEPPFLKIDEETIQHFSHQEHYMKLHEKKTIGDKDKFCEACTLPVMISQRYYACMQCDFILDEACASLPLKIYNPLHKHPLTLHPFPTADTSRHPNMPIIKILFSCHGCRRYGCGFLYRCHEKDCHFQLDVKCASLPDPLIHGCHPHDLFFNLTRGNCIRCGSEWCSSYFLECIECNSFLGIKCATLPSEAHYRHDRHPLTLCYGEEDTTSGQYWCEICESKLDSRKWFYTCDSCKITLHVTCLLGKDIYMKPNFTFVSDGDQFEIARNDGNSRLLCSNCNFRCTQTLVFKRRGEYESFCTLNCLDEYLNSYEKSEPRRPESRDTTSD